MEVDEVREGELLAAASGIVLVLVMLLLDWYGVAHHGFLTGSHHGRGGNAFASFTILDLLLLFTGVFAIVLAALSANEPKPNTPVALSALLALVSFVAVLLLAIRMIDVPRGLELRSGAWIGLLATIGIFAGSCRALREGSPAPARGGKPGSPGGPEKPGRKDRGRVQSEAGKGGDRGSASAPNA